MKRSILFAAGVALLGGAVAVGENPPVARVLDLQGSVSIRGADGKARPATLYATVYDQELLDGDARSQVTIAFRSDGHLERLQGVFKSKASEIGCDPPGARQQRRIAAAKKQAGQWVTELPPSIGGVEVARGGDTVPQLQPIMNSTIVSDRPSFSWPAVPQTGSYQVSVYRGNRELWSVATDKNMLSYPAQPPLQPGKSYEWEVTVVTTGRPHKVYLGKFTVAGDAVRAGAAELRELLESSDPAWVALAAGHYQKERLLAEAIDGYERLAKLAPQLAYSHAALASLYARAGRNVDSEAAEKRARELGFKFDNDD